MSDLSRPRGGRISLASAASPRIFSEERGLLPAVWHPAANLGVVGLDRVPAGSAAPRDDRERMAAKHLKFGIARGVPIRLCRGEFITLSRCALALIKANAIVEICSESLPPMTIGQSPGWAGCLSTSRPHSSPCTLWSPFSLAWSWLLSAVPCSTSCFSIAHASWGRVRFGASPPTRSCIPPACCSGSRSKCTCSSCSAAKWKGSSASALTLLSTRSCFWSLRLSSPCGAWDNGPDWPGQLR